MNYREIVFSMGKFNREHRNRIHTIMESEGLFYGQLPILEVVKKLGSCTQKEISKELGVTPPSVTTSVKRLVKKGYLEKKADEKDLRNTRITITESGLEKTLACRKKFDEFDAQSFSALTEEECELFKTLIDKLIQSMEKEDTHD